jgi:RimJ/RimL family protein N-acetyltransferase
MYDFPVDNPILQELFDPDMPNSPALWAILKGNHTGKAVVDSAQKPVQCVVRTDAALTYFGYQTSQAFLDKAIEHFRMAGPIWLVWPHETSLHPPEINDAKIINRLEFFDTSLDILDKLRKQLPDRYTIQEINEQLLKHCEWRTEMEFYTGSSSNFLKHGVGLCMMQGEEIIVEAYASALGKSRAEIGAITHEAYRGRGFAPIAGAYLIKVCEQLGYQAYWSCDADHRASIRVAQKLGFQTERAYQVFEYEPFS